ncbi:hypothetical protein PtrV1_09816 [Pyrenophora tritici-repentis]|nr:hypothetical protein PtrV1_09816 [Pyrenophora tritici-repentis]
MAATESSSLVTKTTVILEKPSDWQEWLFLRRDKATLNGIWEYCNPDMSQHELKKLIEPVRPTPATVAEGVTLRSQLTHEQRLDYQDLLDAWEYDQKTYLHRQKALNELTSEIAQTTARSNLYLLEGKSTAYERLKALKEHLSPNTARRSRELVVKYRDLQATRRGRAVEGWLDDWIKITDQMRTLNLPDVNGSRSQEDFLIAVKPLDDAWATMKLTDLLAKDEAGTPVPSLRDYVSKFRTFHSRTSPRAAGIGTFSATLGMADTNGGHKQRKPKCFCGEYHLFIECKYCNPKLREDGWQGDKDIFEAKERAKKHPKLKDYILQAEKGQGPSKKRPEMTSSKNVTTIPNRQKSTLVNVIKALIAKIQRQFEYTVVVFRIDSEPGYRELLYDVCKELGIKIEARAADTPAQNPNAERAGRVIVERGRALRISSGLPKELANELVITAAMLLNITPTESLDWETPYQRVFEEAERLIEILDIPTPQALIDIEDLLSPLHTDVNEQAERAQPIGLLSQLSGGQQLARLARIG